MPAGVTTLLIALVCTLIGGFVWQRRNGRMRPVGRARPAAQQAGARTPARLTAGQLGHELGQRATLVQFSSAFCAPCRATRRILTDVAGLTEGVAYIEVDAESRLDLVRSLGVLRTPTVLVTDGDGTIVTRASGQPRKPDVIAAIGLATEGESRVSPIAGRE